MLRQLGGRGMHAGGLLVRIEGVLGPSGRSYLVSCFLGCVLSDLGWPACGFWVSPLGICGSSRICSGVFGGRPRLVQAQEEATLSDSEDHRKTTTRFV